jgi:glycerol-3-phosphate dehydrogenase
LESLNKERNMNRKEMIRRLKRFEGEWDFVVIGGGATGLGVAIEAASRGYRPILIEQSDFAKGTSSRSTKLVHGGVRYLQQGNISLVLEALKERGLMRRNAPHLVHNLPFVVPNYDWWEGPFYGIGLKLYDMLAGRHGFGHSKGLSREKTLEFIPTLEPKGLRGGIVYHDGQFDDARLAINLARTAHGQGAVVINYMGALRLIKENDMVRGLVALDKESGETHEIRARVVINATGVYTDAIRRMDEPDTPPMVTPSQGVHIVLDKRFLPGETAIMVPHTDDGRVLFAIPWHNRVVVGTTDTLVRDIPLDPKPLPEELDFLLSHTARYLTQDPRPGDVLSAFAGLRPLVAMGEGENTAAISRDHTLNISRSGLVTITGGKWTTYRRMAEDTIDHALVLAQLEERPSVTRQLPIHGYHRNPEIFGDLAAYGSDATGVKDVFEEAPRFGECLHPELPFRAGEVIWAVRQEMARTVEDFLSRRTRALLLDARKSMEMAPAVAALMADALGRDDSWRNAQIEAYLRLAQDYLMT